MKSVYFKDNRTALDAVNHSNAAFVLFCAPSAVHELSQQVKQSTVLCSAAGEYCSLGYQNGIISGFEYDPQMAEIIPIDPVPALSIKDMKQAYQKVKNNPNAFLLLLCEGLSKIEEKIMTSLYFMDKDFKVIGGSAGDDLSFTETPVYIGREKVHSVGLFFDCNRRTYLARENIYRPSGKEMLVTDADPMNRIVRSFNGSPASTQYAKNLGVSERDLNNHFMNHPLGIEYDSEIYIASPQKINGNQSLSFYCQIMPNSFVKILEPLSPEEVIKETLKGIPFKPQFLLAINCILRCLKFQQEGLWPVIDQNLTGACQNTTGFISYGEQFYQRHVNQTMILLAIE